MLGKMRIMVGLRVAVVLCVIGGVLADTASTANTDNGITVTQIASGISWAENLAFNNIGSLFATNRLHGSVIRIDYDPVNNSYSQSVHLSGNKILLGLALDPRSDGEFMFTVGRNSSDTSVLIRFNTQKPEQFEVVAVIPDDKVGNGLGVNFKTGLVYTSSEGDFLPKNGEVYEIDPVSGHVNIISINQLWAADGLWIDQDNQILYVGQLFDHNVWAYNLALHQEIGIFPGLNGGLLDDFCLSPDGQSIIGANWYAGTIDSIPINLNATQPEAQVFVPAAPKSGAWFTHPTSARWGSGHPGFPATSLFVSQGADVFEWQASDGVFRVDF